MRASFLRPWLAAGLLLVAGCERLDQDGMVLALEPGYRAEVIASEEDGLASPDGLLWSEGTLYVADEGGSAVRAWSPGRAIRTLADGRTGIASPEDLVRDAVGNLYFSDDSQGGLWRIDRGGVTAKLAGARQGLSSTEAVALAPSGHILIGDPPGHRILSLSPNGQLSLFLGPEHGIGKPESLAFDSSGNLFIADNQAKALYLLTIDGKLHRPIADRRGFSPESIHYSGGALYITDSDHGKLFRYTPEDGLITLALFGGELANVQGLTADERGNIYLSVQSDLKGKRGYILRLSRTGQRP